MRIRDMDMEKLTHLTRIEFNKLSIPSENADQTLINLFGQNEAFKGQDWYDVVTQRTLDKQFDSEQLVAEWIAKQANSEEVHNMVNKVYSDHGYSKKNQ